MAVTNVFYAYKKINKEVHPSCIEPVIFMACIAERSSDRRVTSERRWRGAKFSQGR